MRTVSITNRANDVDRTSQLSRIAQSPAATDLRGGKTSEALSTVRRNNLAAEDAVCFQSDLSLDAVSPMRTGSRIAGSPVSSVRDGKRNGAGHVLSDSPPREIEGVGIVLSSMSGWGGGSTLSACFPSILLLP